MSSLEPLKCATCGAANGSERKFCGSCGARLALVCPSCGAPNESQYSFCGECGSALVPADGTQESAQAPRSVTRDLPESFGDGRYLVSAFLGEGARKRVYRASDSRLGREVAVAEVKAEGLDDEALTRVWQEARSMARLGDHPNVVTVHDVIDGQTGPVVVSQYMAGGALADRLETAPDHRLEIDEVLRIARDVCAGLEHAHGLAVVHRDIKPANIWFDSGGRALLGDFGLALGVDGHRVTVEGMMLGTVAYMPPEQAVGREADARADLYSLGAVLYEMLTGRPPFLGADTVAVISQHLNTSPVLPSWLRSDIEPGLEALVMDLLAKTPAERPDTAAAVRARVEALAAGATPTPSVPRAGGGTTAWRFVGREEELTVLRSAVDAAVGARGSVVMVVGEPGIGKTRTTEQAAAYASLRGMQVLVGRCFEGDASIPYLPFIEAIRTHVVATDTDQLRSELRSGGSDVAKLVSEVRERVADLPSAAPADGPEQERRRLFESVSSFLVNASVATPIMLVLDDLHWADRPSLLLLRHLVRHLPTARLLVVGTYRDVELDRRHPLAEVLADLRRDHAFERVLLRGLSVDEVLAFLEAAAEHDVEGPVRRLIPTLHRETEGNPFFLRELLIHMVTTGRFVRRGDRWVLADPDISELGIPEGIREVVGRRLSVLSERANSALADAAVLGRDFEFPVLAQMQGVSEDELLEVIEEALASQLISERSGGTFPAYAFSHALVRETLYDELSLPRKQRRHLAAGRALEAVHGRDRDRVAPILASHFRLAGTAADPAVTLDYANRAAQAALAVYAWEDAIAHLEAAAEIMGDSGADAETRADLAVRIGDLRFLYSTNQIKGVEVLETALSLYEEAGNERRAAQVHSRLGRALATLGGPLNEVTDVSRGIAHLEAAEKVLADGRDRASLVHLYQAMAAAYFQSGDCQAGVAAGEAASQMSERLGDEGLAAGSAVFLGNNLVSSGRIEEGLALMERAREDNHRLGQVFLRWCAAIYGSQWLLELGDPSGAEQIARQELARQDHGGAVNLRTQACAQLASSLIGLGHPKEAEACMSDIGFDPMTSPGYLIARGHWEAALKQAAAWEETVSGRGTVMVAQGMAALGARALALLGRPGEAVERIEKWIGVIPAFGPRLLSHAAVWSSDAGEADAAHCHLGALEALPILDQNVRGWTAHVLSARAAVSAAEGSHRRAVDLYGQAIACYDDVFDRADSLRRRARSLAAIGRSEEALADLSSALEICEMAGAGPAWTDPVVAERIAIQGVSPSDTGASIAVVAASVATEQPDLVPHAASDGTVTLIFTDLGDSTAINEQLGDRAWFGILQAHHDQVRSIVDRHGGNTVKSQGDGFMLAFPSARRAVECAIALQKAASSLKAGSEPLGLRVGIHTGEVLRQGTDFFGRHVNLAARVAASAQPGQILVSSLVQGLVSGQHDLRFDGPRSVELKGFERPETVYEVVWS